MSEIKINLSSKELAGVKKLFNTKKITQVETKEDMAGKVDAIRELEIKGEKHYIGIKK